MAKIKTKIVIVAQFMRKGGAERVLSIIANYLAEQGYKVELVLLYDAPIEYFIDEKVMIRQFRWKRKCSVYRHIMQCIELRNAINNSITISFLFNAIFYVTISSIFQNNKVIISERNDPRRDPDSKLKRWVRDRCYRYADRVVFQTNDQVNCYHSHIRNKGIIIPNPVEKINLLHDVNRCEKSIITVGRLEEQKNIYMGIDAFELFHREHGEYCYHIYGEGSEKERLLKYIKDKCLDNCVFIHGFCSEIYPVICNSSVFILPSNFEGISNAMLEAMAMGVPVVCTDCPIGGARQIIINEVNGTMVPVNDYMMMAYYMAKITDDNKFSSFVSRNAVEVAEKYSKEKVGAEWQRLIDSIPLE